SRPLLTIATAALVLGSALSAPAAAFVWNVSTPGANNWNVNGNWNVANFPGSADTAVFSATGIAPNATTINNVVSADTTVTSLLYTNVVSGQWHVTQIPSGVTLTVTNLTVGFLTNDGLVTSVAMTDAGTLRVFGTSMNVGDCGSSAVPGNS